MAEKRCVLYDRECIECGECNLCDLDPTKVCDNCGKCIGLNLGKDSPEYRAIRIDGIIDETMDPKEYLYDKNENQACFAKSFDEKHARFFIFSFEIPVLLLKRFSVRQDDDGLPRLQRSVCVSY